MTGVRLSAAILCLLSVHLMTARAELIDARVQEITAQLAKIDSPLQVERIVHSQDLLASEDRVLRSLALPKILASSDSRVRAIGFSYLVDVQKRFVISIAVPDKKTQISEQLRKALTDRPILVAAVEQYQKPVGQFTGSILNVAHLTAGSIGTDGLTFIFAWLGNCRLQFQSATTDNLTGSLDCGPDLLLATSPLP